MIVSSTDGTAVIGIWTAKEPGTVSITTYGDLNFSTFNAAELIYAIQKESK